MPFSMSCLRVTSIGSRFLSSTCGLPSVTSKAIFISRDEGSGEIAAQPANARAARVGRRTSFMPSPFEIGSRTIASTAASGMTLEGADFARSRALLTLDRLVLPLLAFLEGFEAADLDFRVVGEEILASLVGGDEGEAPRLVEPLHRA